MNVPVHVTVTAEHIATETPSGSSKEPLARAIADAVGLDVSEVMVDGDGENRAIATLGTGTTTLVQELPAAAGQWYWRFWNEEPVQPIEFDFEIEHWLVALAHGDPVGVA